MKRLRILKRTIIAILLLAVINIAIFGLIIIILNIVIDEKMLLEKNWGIDIPKAQKVEVIYKYEFRDGQDFEKWYYKKEDINKIITNNKFQYISTQNKELVIERLNNYYEVLDDEEKKLFENNIDIESIVQEKNFFSLIIRDDDKRNWALLLLDCQLNILYYFCTIS